MLFPKNIFARRKQESIFSLTSSISSVSEWFSHLLINTLSSPLPLVAEPKIKQCLFSYLAVEHVRTLISLRINWINAQFFSCSENYEENRGLYRKKNSGWLSHEIFGSHFCLKLHEITEKILSAFSCFMLKSFFPFVE